MWFARLIQSKLYRIYVMARHGCSFVTWQRGYVSNMVAIESIIISHAIFILDSKSNIGVENKYFVYWNTFFVDLFSKKYTNRPINLILWRIVMRHMTKSIFKEYDMRKAYLHETRHKKMILKHVWKAKLYTQPCLHIPCLQLRALFFIVRPFKYPEHLNNVKKT